MLPDYRGWDTMSSSGTVGLLLTHLYVCRGAHMQEFAECEVDHMQLCYFGT